MKNGLALFSVAKEALAEARRFDEVKDVRDTAERLRLYGEQAGDRTIIADATEIIMRAEMRLGELLRSAHETGQLGIGRPSRSNVEGVAETEGEEVEAEEKPQRFTLKEAGISKALSRRSQQMAAVDDDAREALIAKTRDKILSGGAVVVNPLRDLTQADKKARRAAREQALAAKLVALPEAKFAVIYADPEWRFKTRSAETGMDRAADNHYPTSDLEAIKARDVASLAADDCVLFLWATVPMLPEALEVLAAWGFKYVSHFVWDKEHFGTGYWNRNQHEILLVGTRGTIPAPAMGDQFSSVIRSAAGEHSAKPEKAYEIIEAYYPTVPKIELNARVARPGWARWGYEAPELNGEPEHIGAAPAAIEIDGVARSIDPALHTFETARPILEKRYATEPGKLLADELGIPLNTLRGWAFKLGLTSKARISAMATERNKAAAK
jgi:N6-adenosine-specific RNA methylase IME4